MLDREICKACRLKNLPSKNQYFYDLRFRFIAAVQWDCPVSDACVSKDDEIPSDCMYHLEQTMQEPRVDVESPNLREVQA